MHYTSHMKSRKFLDDQQVDVDQRLGHECSRMNFAKMYILENYSLQVKEHLCGNDPGGDIDPWCSSLVDLAAPGLAPAQRPPQTKKLDRQWQIYRTFLRFLTTNSNLNSCVGNLCNQVESAIAHVPEEAWPCLRASAISARWTFWRAKLTFVNLGSGPLLQLLLQNRPKHHCYNRFECNCLIELTWYIIHLYACQSMASDSMIHELWWFSILVIIYSWWAVSWKLHQYG